jgi:hypothetical protein
MKLLASFISTQFLFAYQWDTANTDFADYSPSRRLPKNGKKYRTSLGFTHQYLQNALRAWFAGSSRR